MRKILNAGIFKRDLSFPIHFQGQIIPASPGDTLASTILANNREHTINSSVYNYCNSLTSTCASSGHFLNLGESKLAYLDCWLGQEVYPGFTFNNQENRHDSEDIHPSAGKPNANLFQKRLKEATKLSKDQLFKFTPWLSMNELVDPDVKEKEEAMTFADVEYVSVELLVVGSGVAGLVASSAFSKAGIRLMLLESDFILGGRLNSEGQSNNTWLRNTIVDLEKHDHVRICNRTQFLKRNLDGTFLAIEKCFKLDGTNSAHPIYKLLRIKAEHAFIACGATERIPVSLNKTIPGIMSAGFF
ncbi:MAG: NAD(P)-binding protein, partial [Pseudomonadota bacterium]|nr:NAD(P)-binding protein [Pseudomonadota bacterium]